MTQESRCAHGFEGWCPECKFEKPPVPVPASESGEKCPACGSRKNHNEKTCAENYGPKCPFCEMNVGGCVECGTVFEPTPPVEDRGTPAEKDGGPYTGGNRYVQGPGIEGRHRLFVNSVTLSEQVPDWMNIAYAQGLSAREEQLREAVEILELCEKKYLIRGDKEIGNRMNALLARVKGEQG